MYAFDFGVDLEKKKEVIPFHKFLLEKKNSNVYKSKESNEERVDVNLQKCSFDNHILD